MPHVSMGTFAVISIMVSKPVTRLSHSPSPEAGGDDLLMSNMTADIGNLTSGADVYSTIQVATAVTFCVGLVQLFGGLCRFGFLAVVLTNTLISAFTVGASFHVLTSQVEHALGIRVKRQQGIGKL